MALLDLESTGRNLVGRSAFVHPIVRRLRGIHVAFVTYHYLKNTHLEQLIFAAENNDIATIAELTRSACRSSARSALELSQARTSSASPFSTVDA